MPLISATPQRCHHVAFEDLHVCWTANDGGKLVLRVRGPCVALSLMPGRVVGATFFVQVNHSSEDRGEAGDVEEILMNGPLGKVRRVVVHAAELVDDEYVLVDHWCEVKVQT